jgi:hypothetical protein
LLFLRLVWVLQSKNALRFCSIGAADLHKVRPAVELFGTASAAPFSSLAALQKSFQFPTVGAKIQSKSLTAFCLDFYQS